MPSIEFRGWRFRTEHEATQQLYAQLGAQSVTYTSVFSRNLFAASNRAYPQEILSFFDEVGIDYRYFGDVWIPDRIGDQLHYHGVFHFGGEILPDSKGEVPTQITRTFCVSFSMGDIAPGVIARELMQLGMTVVQMDFETVVPWVLNEPFPKGLPELSPGLECSQMGRKIIEI